VKSEFFNRIGENKPLNGCKRERPVGDWTRTLTKMMLGRG
jgi:hypothetical protein